MVDALYFNRVERAPFWYTQSGVTTIAEVVHVLRTGLQLQPISTTNKPPVACNRHKETRKKAVKVSVFDHELIMEEAGKCDRLKYDDSDEETDDESQSEIDSE